jgi:Transglycosylase SLT domain
MITQPILQSFTALVFFLYGGLGFPSLPPMPPAKPVSFLQKTPPVAPERIRNRIVELTQRLEPDFSSEMARRLLQVAIISDPKFKAHLNLLIKKLAKLHGVDEKLIRAVLAKESGGNPLAVSPKGAMGLMQLMPETAMSLGVEDPFNPEQNLAGGVRYLKYCLNRFSQDTTLALAAYNAGPEAVQKCGGVPPYPETQQYVASILGCPVEDIVKKSKTTGAEKGQGKKPGTPEDTKSAVHVPKPAWKVVRSEVNVPAPKWKTFPSFTALNSPQLKDGNTPNPALYSKNFSRLPEDDKEAASPTSVAIPRLLKNPGNW